VDDIEDRVPNQFQSWMVGLQWRDMPLEGSDPGFAMGQPQFVTQLEGGDTPFDATTPGNLWYQFQVTDNISVTPALFYLSRPQGNLAGPTYDNSFSMFGGLVQTTSSSEPMAIAPGITALVGCAPLARLHRSPAAEGCRAELAAKLDGFNPTASVKDRIAGTMAEAAAREGRISPGRTVLAEPTNGNTGAALAMVAAARGYRLILTYSRTP